MFKLDVINSDRRGLLLVDPRPILLDPMKRSLFVTISPNPKAIIKTIVKAKSTKMIYKMLPHRLQYEYIINYFRQTYFTYLSQDYKIVITFELNKESMLHAHLLIYDPDIQSDYDIMVLRQNIRTECSTRCHLTNKGEDYCNNIVYVNDSIKDRLDYLFKDIENSEKHFPPLTNIIF